MTIDNAIRILAGIVMLISIGLSFISPYWLILGGLVSLNLIQSAFTGGMVIGSLEIGYWGSGLSIATCLRNYPDHRNPEAVPDVYSASLR